MKGKRALFRQGNQPRREGQEQPIQFHARIAWAASMVNSFEECSEVRVGVRKRARKGSDDSTNHEDDYKGSSAQAEQLNES